MRIRNAILLALGGLALGWVLGVLWHKLWLPPLPQVSSLRQLYSNRFSTEFRSFPAREAEHYTADRIAGHVRRSHQSNEYDWPEHPTGSVRMVTNNLGLREDTDTRERKEPGTYRILVSGDSHTDGVVYNAESFANRLEAGLNSAGGGRFEVLNAGTGHHGPYNYFGILRKDLELEPDVFVVVLYTGNDFLDALRTARQRRRVRIPNGRPKGYFAALKEAIDLSRGAVAQALNQIYFFKTYPLLTGKAIKFTLEPLREIQNLCEKHDIELLVLTLPTRCDTDRDPASSSWHAASQRLGLTAENLAINRGLTQHLLNQLDLLGITVVDLSPWLVDRGEELYWERDYHLNHRGHEVVAEVLLERFRQALSLP